MRFAFVSFVLILLLSVSQIVEADEGKLPRAADAQAAALARLKALGAQIQRKKDGLPLSATLGAPLLGRVRLAGDTVIGINLIDGSRVKDSDLKDLEFFPEITDLYLGNTSISDAGLVHLKSLKHLAFLGLAQTKITDAGLQSLADMQELRGLVVGETAVTDTGLAEIARHSKLRALGLEETAITDAGIEKLLPLKYLVQLDLSKTRITDRGLVLLTAFTSLRTLSLSGTGVSDAGLAALRPLPKLSQLLLNQCKVTDAGVNELGQLKALRQLSIVDSKVTPAGMKRLQELLPHTGILRKVGIGQQADPSFDTSVSHPAYPQKHPKVLFDAAHRNFHTAEGRYKAFAGLLTHDGYSLTSNHDAFTAARLAPYQLLVVANAPAVPGDSPSAFTTEEIDSVVNWVRGGGALLLITDHEPYGSGSADLGKRFGVDMSLRVTVDPVNQQIRGLLFSRAKHQLGDHPILNGRNASERIDRVLTFTGQSLKGPPGSVALLKFADTAVDIGSESDRKSAAGRAQGIAFECGRGRVVVMGEAGDLSAQIFGDPPVPMGMNVPGCDNRQFALNIVHWLTGLIN